MSRAELLSRLRALLDEAAAVDRERRRDAAAIEVEGSEVNDEAAEAA